MAQIKVLAFAGSTREDAYNKKLIKQAAELARQRGAIVTLIDLREYSMPLYDADLEIKQGMPSNAKLFKKLMIDSDAIIIATPEYNGSISAVLKNTIDWASRTEDGKGSREAFKGKKFAIMSASPGGGGGGRALVHLRSILEALGGEVIPLQVTVPNASQAFNDKGGFASPALKEGLQNEIDQLLQTTNQTLLRK